MIALLVLLTAHFVADFVLQSDWMALGKSKSWKPLTVHVLVYTLTLTAALVLYGWYTRPILTLFFAVTFATHWVTDFLTSRYLTSKLWFIELYKRPDDERDETGEYWQYSAYDHYARVSTPLRHWFFVAIGFDQLIHVWTLALTYLWLVQ